MELRSEEVFNSSFKESRVKPLTVVLSNLVPCWYIRIEIMLSVKSGSLLYVRIEGEGCSNGQFYAFWIKCLLVIC
jgi:hypothetical protein